MFRSCNFDVLADTECAEMNNIKIQYLLTAAVCIVVAVVLVVRQLWIPLGIDVILIGLLTYWLIKDV